MGAPNATATPAALAALSISRRLPGNGLTEEKRLRVTDNTPSLFSYLPKYRLTVFPIQLAMCTNGPSFPRESPDATENASPIALVKRVRAPR